MSLTAKNVDLTKGTVAGEQALPKNVFGQKIKNHLIYDAVKAQLASRRQGTSKVKARGEVSGGNKKPFKQKGTGSARQGSSRSPLMVGGGVVFGPRPRNFEYDIPKQARIRAMTSALSAKAKDGKVFVAADFKLAKPSTKVISGFLKQLNLSKALIVDTQNAVLQKSVRNIAGAKYSEAKSMNVFDVLKFDTVIVSKEGLKIIESRFGHDE